MEIHIWRSIVLKYRYKFEEKFKSIILDLTESQLEHSFLIEGSFGADILERTYDIQRHFNHYFKVLIGEEHSYYGGGNVNSIIAYSNFTLLEDLFEDEEEEKICKIETIEFMKLLLVWAEEVFKCKRRYEKISEEKFVNSNLWLKQAWTKINEYEEQNR